MLYLPGGPSPPGVSVKELSAWVRDGVGLLSLDRIHLLTEGLWLDPGGSGAERLKRSEKSFFLEFWGFWELSSAMLTDDKGR